MWLRANCLVAVRGTSGIELWIPSQSHSSTDSQSTVAIDLLCQCMYKPQAYTLPCACKGHGGGHSILAKRPIPTQHVQVPLNSVPPNVL
jgi:hypothetical protein